MGDALRPPLALFLFYSSCSSLSLELPFFLSLASFPRIQLSYIMVATWAGDAVAPFFGFIGAAAALVFSCAFLLSSTAFLMQGDDDG